MFALGRSAHVESENRNEGDRIHQIETPFDGNQKRINRRQTQVHNFSLMARFELDGFFSGLKKISQDHRRPTDTDQQAVGAGHIRHRERRVFWVLTCLPSEIHIDGVLGKHRDQRQQSDR
jgi:hypothetical protein